jgi:ankyrin repeat protein
MANRPGYKRKTLIHNFIFFYLIEILDILLSHDQNLVQRSYKAAIIASRLGHDKCLEILLNYGMDPNISDRTNTIPLHVAYVKQKKISKNFVFSSGFVH